MKKESTHDRILEQTLTLIRQQGYQNITLRQLTAQLNVTTGAFYKAFKDKEELYYQAWLLESKRQDERWQAAYLSQIESPLDGLWTIGLFFLSEYESDAKMMDFLFFNPVAIKTYRQGLLLAVGERAVAYIETLPIADAEEKQRLLLKLNAFISGYGHFISSGVETFDEAVYRSLFEDILGGYRYD